MDIKYVVFAAVRDNNLTLLKNAFSNKSNAEIAIILAAKIDGATPLVIACRYGHYNIVEYLLIKCQANVEEVGSVSFDGEPIEDAPPLWCAAAAGHLNIVKLLVRHGADVNKKTKTNSTPLRAACFDGHLEIVKFLISHGADFEVVNRHGHTCLMIACYKGHYEIAKYLLSLKADVNRCSLKGNTALHDCAESGSLKILKLLLNHGAKITVDYYGMTPLLAASVTGHSAIVEHLIKLPSVSRENQIDALELLGATYVDKRRDITNALALWRRAMEERNKEPKIPKIINDPIKAYEYVSEVTDIEALEELLSDPDEMRMQALVIRQRILGPTHPDTSYYIRYRGANYADAGRFDRCIELWTYALTMQQKILAPLSCMTQSSLLSFAELFSFMLVEAGRLLPRGRVVPPINVNDMLMIFKNAIVEVERGKKWMMNQETESSSVRPDAIMDSNGELNSLSRALVSALHIGCLLAYVLEDDTHCGNLRKDILHSLYRLNKLNVKLRGGRTALHYSCCRGSSPVSRYPACQFPSIPLTKALLTIGADPNVTDDDGNTPLHLTASVTEGSICPSILATALLENGAHFDIKNNAGETFESLIRPRNLHQVLNPLKHINLACLAARKIRDCNIKYKESVPISLHKFIEMH